MRKNNNALEPHTEKQIVLSMTDKIIFAIGASVYGVSLIIEEKFGVKHEISSSAAIAAVGIFLAAKAIQNRKSGKLLNLKDKLMFCLMLFVGIALVIGSTISLIKYLAG